MKYLSLQIQFIFLSLIVFVSCQSADQSSFQKANQILLDDMILDRDSIAESQTESDVGELAAGGYKEYNSQPWKNAIMPVAFESNITQAQKDWFIKIAQQWSIGTPVRIINRTKENEYLLVTNKDPGCYSEVGASPGQTRQLNLGPNCWTEGVALHEMGHALGLMHEHQRPDRDSYISINFNNVDPNLHYAFTVFSTANNATPYDFQSIMHYSQYAFSNNRKVTINTLSQYAKFQNTMGIKKISALDRKAISNMYSK
jgi:Astacin (Peptidase family M12A)